MIFLFPFSSVPESCCWVLSILSHDSANSDDLVCSSGKGQRVAHEASRKFPFAKSTTWGPSTSEFSNWPNPASSFSLQSQFLPETPILVYCCLNATPESGQQADIFRPSVHWLSSSTHLHSQTKKARVAYSKGNHNETFMSLNQHSYCSFGVISGCTDITRMWNWPLWWFWVEISHINFFYQLRLFRVPQPLYYSLIISGHETRPKPPICLIIIILMIVPSTSCLASHHPRGTCTLCPALRPRPKRSALMSHWQSAAHIIHSFSSPTGPDCSEGKHFTTVDWLLLTE